MHFNNNLGQFILRVSFASMMLLGHGLPKLKNFNELSNKFPDPLVIGSELSLYLTIGAEVLCAIFLILGLLTRIATLPLIIVMVVALFGVHGGDSWQKQELAALYLSGFCVIGILGPGEWSLDKLIIDIRADLWASRSWFEK